MKGFELADLFEKHAEKLAVDLEPSARYRSLSYKNASDLIAKTFGEKQITEAGLSTLKLTEYMKNKILETIKLGKVSSSGTQKDASKKDSAKKIIEQLASHSGIGMKRAEEFYKAGIRKLDDLLEKKFQHLLTAEIKAFMEMKPLATIPHEDIKLVESALMKCFPGDLMFVGSFRRKKPFSSDIDLMLTSSTSKASSIESKEQKTDFDDLLKCFAKLSDRFLIYAEGPDKISLIADFSRLTKKKDNKMKVDIFRTVKSNKLPYLLYSTGSKENNVAMRGKAKRMGLLLNQNGLFKGEKRIDEKFTSEKDYYDALGMPYKTPEER